MSGFAGPDLLELVRQSLVSRYLLEDYSLITALQGICRASGRDSQNDSEDPETQMQ